MKSDWLRGQMLGLALLALVLFGFAHGHYGLFDVDEAIFTQATREMVQGGEWALPTYNAEPRYHKPPLIYWLQETAMAQLGEDSLWAARLPSAICALLTVLLLGVGVARLTGNIRWGLVAAAMMALNLSFLVIGRAAVADAALNLFMLAGALSVVRQVYGPFNKQWGVVTGIVLALGLLTKGPVAVLSAGLVGLTALAVRDDRREVWRKLQPWTVLGIMVLGAIPWVVAIYMATGWDFFYEFIVVHNLDRFFGGMGNTHSSSHFYYAVIMLLGFLPWVGFLVPATPWVVNGFVKRVRSRNAAEALPALALVWAVGTLALFSFSATKLAHYVVPAWPALSIVAAGWLERAVKARGEKSHWWVEWRMDRFIVWPVLLLLAAVVALLPAVLVGLRTVPLRGVTAYIQTWFEFEWPPSDALAFAVMQQQVTVGIGPYVLAGLLVLALVAYEQVWVKNNRAQGLAALAVVWACALWTVIWGIVPVVWDYSQKPLAVLAAQMDVEREDMPVIHLGLHKPSVLYLSQRKFKKLEQPLQLGLELENGASLILTEQPTVGAIRHELSAITPSANVGREACIGGYCLLWVNRVIE